MPGKPRPCRRNPRTCPDAPNPKLADAIRTSILEWPGPSGIRKRLEDSVVSLAAAVQELPRDHEMRKEAIREYLSNLSAIDSMLKEIETALSHYAAEEE
jgi:hypothetical protein